MLSLDDAERLAKARLPKPLFEYIRGAAEEGASYADNRAAFSEWRFDTRVLMDTSARSLHTELFGQRYDAPFAVAPMGILGLSAYRGDAVLKSAADAHGIPFILSATSLAPMESVLSDSPASWFQAYLPPDGARIEALLERLQRTGCKTLVVTVDLPVAANRENNVRAGFSMPLRPSLGLALQGALHPRWSLGVFLRTLATQGMPHFENSDAKRGAAILSANAVREFTHRDRLSWEHIRLVRSQWRGTLLLKGLLDVQTPLRARDEGIDGVILSNHGGRQLDGAISALRVLPAVRKAMPDYPLLLDGGIRRGADVLKALALGANFVLVGRPFNFAMAAGGAAGASHAMALLKAEIERNMAMLGVCTPQELSAERLWRVATAKA
jgi:L-lactate dehydrogenase (cytochrome)